MQGYLFPQFLLDGLHPRLGAQQAVSQSFLDVLGGRLVPEEL